MKAFVLHKLGDLRIENTPVPGPGENEVLVAVKAAGICGSDIPRAYTTGAYFYPLVLGHEFSGIVESIGAGVESSWRGKRVGVFPLIPCGNCIPCQKKQYEMCRHYSYLGSRKNGGFAEYVAVPSANLIELSDDISYEQAAMLEPMAVAVHALRKAGIGMGDCSAGAGKNQQLMRIAICGLGTIGLLLLQFLLDSRKQNGMGADNIFVIGNKEFQKQSVLKMGIKESCYIDSTKTEVGARLSELTEEAGVDVFFECVGKNETISMAVDNTAPAGRIVLTGNPASDIGFLRSVYWKILRNQLTIVGTWNSSFTGSHDDDWHYVCGRLRDKAVVPEQLITHRYPLEKLGQGFEIMRDKTQDYVKIMGIL